MFQLLGSDAFLCLYFNLATAGILLKTPPTMHPGSAPVTLMPWNNTS